MRVAELRSRIQQGLIIYMTTTKAEHYALYYGDLKLSNDKDVMALPLDQNGDITLCMKKKEAFQLGMLKDIRRAVQKSEKRRLYRGVHGISLAL